MKKKLNIRSLSIEDASKILQLPEDVIRGHILRGLPLPGGRVDLIIYGAWLNQRERRRDS